MARQKIILGLVGEKGGGKGAFFEILEKLLPNKKIERIRSGDMLADTLKSWDLPNTRENLIKLAVALNQSYGPDVISKAVEKRLRESTANVVIFDGVRWDSDVSILRALSNSLLVYITANAQIRFQRSKARREKAGEDQATFDQFLKEEKSPTEALIPQIGKQADVTLTNNGTITEFEEQIREFIDSRLEPGT